MAQEIAAPPNTNFVVRKPLCTEEPCLICWLLARVREEPATKDATFDGTPLKVNIVGVRRKASINNTFDDLMVVFFRLLSPSNQDAFARAVEAELLSEIQTCLDGLKKTEHEPIRYVPCQQGMWVVATFTVTTDPGFQDSLEAVKRALETCRVEIPLLEESIKKYTKDVARYDEALVKAQAALKALTTPKKKKDAPLPKLDLPPAVDDIAEPKATVPSLREYTAAVTINRRKSAKSLRDARALLETRKSEQTKGQQTLKEKIQKNDELVPLRQGTDGWIDEGRAIVPVGVHVNAYRYFLHHSGSANKFPRATVALYIPEIEAGLRMYSVKYLRSTRAKSFFRAFESKGSFPAREIRQHWPASGEPVLFDPGTATLEIEKREEDESDDGDAPLRDAYLVRGKDRTPLPPEDVVVLKGSIGGTNIHRAHNVSLVKPDCRRLWGKAADKDDRVGPWSEGCQTFPGFTEFNTFLRVCAISKRWQCANKDPMRIGRPECGFLEASVGSTIKEGEALRPGEQALLERFEVDYINVAVAASYTKDAERAAEEAKKLQLDKSKLDLSKEQKTQLAELRAREEATVTKEERAKHKEIKPLNLKEKKMLEQLCAREDLTEENADKIEKLSQQIDRATSEQNENEEIAATFHYQVRLAELPDEIEELKESIKELKQRIEKLEGAKSAKAKRSLERVKQALDKQTTILEQKEKELEECQKHKDLSPENVLRRQQFLRERAQTFRADYLRTCDLKGTCGERFTYTLIELPGTGMAELQERFKEQRNRPWKGEFVMGAAKAATAQADP